MIPAPSRPARPSATRLRAASVWAVLVSGALISLLLAVAVGSVPIAPGDWWPALRDAFTGQPTTLAGTLVDLRMSRAASAMATGAALSLAGVLMQALLRNPLADPYVLGVSGGASVGALAGMSLGLLFWQIDMLAFAGAGAATLLLMGLARDDFRGAQGGAAPLLLLTGVIVAAGCGALVTLMLSMAPDGTLRGMVFWLIGDLSGTRNRLLPWAVLLAGLAFCVWRARAMNLLAMMGDQAVSLGVHVGRLRLAMFLTAAALTATAVTTAGSISFLGLIVPHACRLALGPDHRMLLPAAALGGGAFLVLTDTVARTVVAPMQLPVGAITALIGVPVFLLQLRQLRRVAR